MTQRRMDQLAGVYKESLEDHKELCKTMVELERAVPQLVDDPRQVARKSVVDSLDDLLKRLRAHFAEEEAPEGLYAELQAALPHRQHQLEALMAEHAEMRDTLVGIRAELFRHEGVERELVDRFLRVLRRLARHESRENACLFEAAGGRDIGTCD